MLPSPRVWSLDTPRQPVACYRSFLPHLPCHPCSTALTLQVVVGLVDVAAVGWVARLCAALRVGCAPSVRAGALALPEVHDALAAAALLPDHRYKTHRAHALTSCLPAPPSPRSARVVLSLAPGAGCLVQEAALELEGLGAAGQGDGPAGGDAGGSGGKGAGAGAGAGAHGGELRPVLAAGGAAAAGAPAVLVRNVWGPGAAEGEPPQVRWGQARAAGGGASQVRLSSQVKVSQDRLTCHWTRRRPWAWSDNAFSYCWWPVPARTRRGNLEFTLAPSPARCG